MARRRSRKTSIEGLIAQLVYCIALLAWPASYGWWKDSPWLVAVAVIAMVAGTIGLLAIVITVRQVHHEEEQRELKTKKDWYRLTPSGFEKHVADLFTARGYQAKVSGRTGDGGVDIHLKCDDKNGIVQCKKYEKNVGVKAVREFCSVASQNRAHESYFVTSSGFTIEARKWAKREPIILIDGDDLIEWTKEARFGAYANKMPRPALFFSVRQWIMISIIAVGSISLLGLVVDLSLGGQALKTILGLLK